MCNVLKKEFAVKEYFFFYNWSYYFSFGYFYCKKLIKSFSNELYKEIALSCTV